MKLINQLNLNARDEKELKEKLRSFRKYFGSNKQLKIFEKAVFDSILEKIILAGIDTKGQYEIYRNDLQPTNRSRFTFTTCDSGCIYNKCDFCTMYNNEYFKANFNLLSM